MADLAAIYARAFAEVAAKNENEAASAMPQLESFVAAYHESRDLREVLGNPSLDEGRKQAVLDSLCGKLGCSQAVRNFIGVIVKNGRASQLPEIVAQTQTELDRQTNVVEAQVITARKLDKAAQHEFEQGLQRLAGSGNVRASYSEDAKLLGGALVRIGSTVYDGSVRGRLDRLREQLATS